MTQTVHSHSGSRSPRGQIWKLGRGSGMLSAPGALREGGKVRFASGSSIPCYLEAVSEAL